MGTIQGCNYGLLQSEGECHGMNARRGWVGKREFGKIHRW